MLLFHQTEQVFSDNQHTLYQCHNSMYAKRNKGRHFGVWVRDSESQQIQQKPPQKEEYKDFFLAKKLILLTESGN